MRALRQFSEVASDGCRGLTSLKVLALDAQVDVFIGSAQRKTRQFESRTHASSPLRPSLSLSLSRPISLSFAGTEESGNVLNYYIPQISLYGYMRHTNFQKLGVRGAKPTPPKNQLGISKVALPWLLATILNPKPESLDPEC